MLYKFRPIDQLSSLADILVNERLFCAPYYMLNDPFEGQFLHAIQFPPNKLFPKGLRTVALTSLEDINGPEDYIIVRVCSLSSDMKDVRLWSHYAGGHRGVAIEIDASESMGDFDMVNYEPKLPLFDDPRYAGPSWKMALTTKTSHWEYEKEYRVITAEEFYPIKGKIKRVIAGVRCKATDIPLIQKLLPNNVPLFRARLDEERTEITIR